jgi:HSP20 family protein
MTLTKFRRRTDWEPYGGTFGFPETIAERMPEHMYSMGGNYATGAPAAWHPSSDVFEDDDTVHVKMDLPGMKKEDIDVSFDGHVLSITGRRESATFSESESYWSRERFVGDFHRYVHIPTEVSPEELKAGYENGVLMVTLNKTDRAMRKKVAVEANFE